MTDAAVPLAAAEGTGVAVGAVRRKLLRRALWLQGLLLLWNPIEGCIAVAAGLAASSVALLGFGADSFIEVASAAVVTRSLWLELHADAQGRTAQRERRAARIAGGLLLALAALVAAESIRRLLGYGGEAGVSRIGIVLTTASLLVMPSVAYGKLRLARRLASPALRADAFETIACAWLSAAALGGLLLNAVLGWRWADPVAGLVLVPLLIKEGVEGLRGAGRDDQQTAE